MKNKLASLVCSSRSLGLALLALAAVVSGRAEDKPLLLENEVQATLRAVQSGGNRAEQLRRAQAVLGPNRWLSSAQVKTLARGIAEEDARIEFALAAYPRTVDPENFYEVYDAFTKFSKAFRLHDRIQELRASVPGGVLPGGGLAAPPVTPAELEEIVKTLRAEPFDETRQKLAKQIVTARVRFNSAQVRDLLKLFTFEETRLALAKAAYEYVVDPESYFVVSQGFTFSDSKEDLTRYIEARRSALQR